MVPCRHLAPPTHAMPRYRNPVMDVRALFFHQTKIRATATRLTRRPGLCSASRSGGLLFAAHCALYVEVNRMESTLP